MDKSKRRLRLVQSQPVRGDEQVQKRRRTSGQTAESQPKLLALTQGLTQTQSQTQTKLSTETKNRSNLGVAVHFIRSLNLRRQHFNVLTKTPFSMLIEAIRKDELVPNKCNRSDHVLYDLIAAYQPSRDCFLLGGQDVKLTTDEIRLIFGFPCGANRRFEAKLKRVQEVAFAARHNIRDRLTTTMMEKMLTELVNKPETDTAAADDTVRLLCMYLIVKLFFPTSGISVSWKHVYLLEDIDNINSYDWACEIREELINSINKFQHVPKNVKGCQLLLPHWLCEHTNILGEEEVDSKVPRLIKWNISNLEQRMVGSHVNIKDATTIEVYADELQPTPVERRLLFQVPEEDEEDEEEEEEEEEEQEQEQEQEHDQEDVEEEEEEEEEEEVEGGGEEEGEEEEEYEGALELDNISQGDHNFQTAAFELGERDLEAEDDTYRTPIAPIEIVEAEEPTAFISEINHLKAENKKLRRQIKSKDKKKKKITAYIEQIKILLGNTSDHEGSHESSDQEGTDALVNEIKVLAEKIKEQEIKMCTLVEDRDTAQVQSESLQIQIQRLHNELLMSKKKEEDQAAEITELKAEGDKTTAMFQKFKKQVQEKNEVLNVAVHDANKVLQVENAELLQAKEAIEAKAKNLEQINMNLIAELNTAKNELTEVLKQKAALQKEKNFLSDAVVEYQAGHEEDDASIQALKEENDSLKLEISEYKKMKFESPILQPLGTESQVQHILGEVHKVTQAAAASKSHPTPPSKMKRIKEKTMMGVRKQNKDEAYVYPMAEAKKAKKAKKQKLEKPAMEGETKFTNFDATKSAVFNLLSPQIKEKIIHIWKYADPSDFVYNDEERGCFIQATEIENTLLERYTANETIDGYAQVLMENQDQNPGFGLLSPASSEKSYVFPASIVTAFSYLKDVAERTEFLVPMLKKAIGSAAYLHVPIIFSDHITLLVLDTTVPDWKYYNSLVWKGTDVADVYLAASDALRASIVDLIKNGTIECSEKLQTITTEPVMAVTPIQQPKSLDCGAIVCYIIKQYFLNNPPPQTMTKTEVRKMRADIIETLLSTQRSWSMKKHFTHP